MGKVVEIDCEKSMKLETSRNVTKSKRSLHWCRSISKKYLCTFYYSISQKVITLSGRRFITVSGVLLHYRAVITVSGVFYYIIGQLLQYRAFITLSVGTNAFRMMHNLPTYCSASEMFNVTVNRVADGKAVIRNLVHRFMMRLTISKHLLVLSILSSDLGAKTIKKNTNSTQNKSQTHRAKQYEVTSFLSTYCELSTETCSKNVYSLGP